MPQIYNKMLHERTNTQFTGLLFAVAALLCLTVLAVETRLMVPSVFEYQTKQDEEPNLLNPRLRGHSVDGPVPAHMQERTQL